MGTKSALGFIAIAPALLALPAIGLAGFNAVQGARLAEDSTLPLFVRATVVDANGHRVVSFGGVAAVLAVVGSIGS